MSLLERTETGEWPTIQIPKGRLAEAKHILNEVIARHGLSLDDVRGRIRIKPYVLCRREAAWLIARDIDLSLSDIARLLNKDHTTIIRAIRRGNEAWNANVKNLGFVTEAEKERMRTFSAEKRRKARDRKQRLRRAELYHVNKTALRLFRRGKDTADIADELKEAQATIANGVTRARSQEMAL
jgi:IS30 family transposase